METTRLLLNVKEAGATLGISPWTIRRYINEGKLGVVRLGRRVLVEPSECRRLVDEGRKTLPLRPAGRPKKRKVTAACLTQPLTAKEKKSDL